MLTQAENVNARLTNVNAKVTLFTLEKVAN